MLSEKNIEELKSRLLALGFPERLEAGLRAHICFGQDSFTLHYRSLREGDVLNVSLQFQKVAEGPGYSCLFYDACLRRQVEITPALIGEVDTADLEARMKQVDWESALPSRFTDDNCENTSAPSWERKAAIEGILTDLGRLGETPEGLALAHRLKMKFWVDSPLEGLIPNLAAQKSTLEISQRFYFFEGEAGITLDEAYRFLCHRWREKQWNAQKRGAAPADTATPVGANGKGAGGKLLPKKRPGKGSKLKL